MSFDVAADLELAIIAAREAGRVVMRSFRTEQKVTHKSPSQPLTEADLAADDIIKRLLLGQRLMYGWLSEETADNPSRLKRRHVWIVDPIDGTRSYIEGYAEFAISIGLAEDGITVLGVVYNPATDEMYAAQRGKGAWRVGGKPLNVLPPNPEMTLASRRMVASRSEIRAGDFGPFEDAFDIHGTGSTAYKLAKVAAGEAQVFVSRGPKSEWDVCAGVLLVEEAGGRATDLHGDQIVYNKADTRVDGILATNGTLHREMIDRVAAMPQSKRNEE